MRFRVLFRVFFLLNHYLYSKKNNLNFTVESDSWLFKYKKGWDDYFVNININTNERNDFNRDCHHHEQIDDFTITEYKDAIKEVYIYNDIIKSEISKMKNILSLHLFSFKTPILHEIL